jgi:hypothetical protein
MSQSRYLSEKTKEIVRNRANYLCEYCHTSERWQYVKFTIDHVIPLAKGGNNSLENLALACFHCNRYKSNKIRSLDPASQVEISLFHPRLQGWNDNFIWSFDRLCIIGVTAVGKATTEALQFNRPRLLEIRKADLEIGRHPPEHDFIQS